jgi:hypothetical protein
MSFPRLSLLLLPAVLCLPLLTGACGAPVAVAAASYGADGVSVMESGKTVSDHGISMLSKRDCALWRVFRNRSICQDQDPDKPNPYKVNYDEPFRQQSESGVAEYSAPPHAAPNAPAASWDAAAYKPAPTAPAAPPTAVADVAPAPAVEPVAAPTPAPAPPAKHKAKSKKVAKAPVKKPSPDQVASAR